VGTQHKGFGELQSVSDLLKKLEYDLSRVNESPTDTYAAFDFFVTAEHMIDWLHPTDFKTRKELRTKVRLLEIVSHIANGNKHFQATAKQHKSVENITEEHGGFSVSAFSAKCFSPKAFKFAGLNIKLDDGSLVHATALAQDVYEYWVGIIKTP